ncbi:flagellar hook-associated protein FlgK [Desulfospira joergensenii]|uniref:flagellar hook-associated protein FlgK n=1 Tax=Desulfospira joergensenii TaxID=53329 RepID=UPI0003B685F1|nr:flagellar hook-associated protein FlgK [Desulfospira joergensenii]
MSGLSSTLSIAKTALAAQQYGLNITGQNIANVNNPNYSVQNADHISRTPSQYAGFLFGTGVDMNQVEQSVDKLLEERLTKEMSTQTSLEEQESYMRVLEGFFDENSQTSLTTVLTEFWNSWHKLSNNAKGSSERVTIFESGAKLASRFESTVLDMDDLLTDINADINSSVGQVNALIKKIADLNGEVVSAEAFRTANDQRDQRNALVDELGKLIDIDIIEQGNGSLIINGANGFPLVNGVDTYELGMSGEDVIWLGSSGTGQAITDKISSGRIGGLLVMRDEVIPKYQAEVNELAREMIWAINYQHSRGAGLEYFGEPMTGTYSTNESGWLTSFEFGDKIDFTQDFTMWTEDRTDAETAYRKIMMDMGISQANITNWQGTAPGAVQSKYKLTVVDEAVLGDMEVAESDGDGLATVWGSTSGVATTLDRAIADQTLMIYNGPDGTSKIEVKDAGGDARRSAASVAEELNKIEGVSAYASETSATFQLVDNGGIQDGDEVKYSLYVDGIIQNQSFIRDSSAGTLNEQFEDSLIAGVESVNLINEDDDLYLDGFTLHSSAGRTLGIQDFEVQDNTGIRLDGFSNFDSGDTVTFTVDSSLAGSGTAAASTTQVEIDLSGVDVTDQETMVQAFYDALSTTLEPSTFTVERDTSSNSILLRTLDGSGIRLRSGSGDTGDDAIVNVTALGGSTTTSAAANTELRFNNVVDASDTVRYDGIALSVDNMNFSGNGTGVTIEESTAAAGLKSSVITGTVTTVVEAGMIIQSNVSGAGSGGLFSTNKAILGSSILTLGGEGGFSGFSSAGGETISFDLDGANISFDTTAGAGTSDLQLAALLEAEITADLITAGIDANYNVVRTGSSVSVIKNTGLDDPIKIENFSDSGGNNAKLNIRTGTGTGSNQPENDTLDADPTKTYRNSTTSSLYDDEGIIMWERLDSNGVRTGVSGLIKIEDEGQASIVENGVTMLTFDIGKGSLVAGNTLTLNTDTSGVPDPLDFRITGQANSINELYQFKVISGGKVGTVPEEGDEPLVIQWSNSVTTGTFTIEGHDPPYTPLAPVEVEVDGMSLNFYDGTLFDGDVFTITTDDTGVPISQNEAGEPTGETMADWHWTLDSFAEQFNRVGGGMKASVTQDNHLKFEASENYYTVQNMEYSGTEGFSEDNVTVTVTDWSAIDFAASDLRFERSGSGVWGVLKDPTGGVLQIIPEGGDDDGFAIDFNGDGLADMRIDFEEAVTGNGYVEFDLNQRNTSDIGYAFSDDASSCSGLAAAAGINTFFTGIDAISMGINEILADTKFVAAASIDSSTGEISKGDNANALGIADVQFQDKTMKIWSYTRGREAQSNTTTASLDNYFNTIISSLGIESRSIKNAKSFADTMVNNITEQRDSVSAVSLDEEMIKLIRYQHAFSAASKLLTVSDEMLNTLISMR